MNKRMMLAGCLVILSLVLARFWLAKESSYQSLHLGETTVHVEVARDSQAITKGLGERDTLGSDGMLFLLPERQTPTFWMQGMRFDLDFVWIDGTKIVDLTPNVKAEPGVSAAQLHLYAPRVPVTKVLELPAGSIARYHLTIGEDVTP